MEKLLKKITPEDYFSFQMFFLKFFGLCPPQSKPLRMVYFAIAIPHFLIILSGPVIFETTNIIISDDSYERKILNVALLCMHTGAAVRIIGWFIMQKEFKVVVAIIKRPTFDFAIFGVSQKKETKNGMLMKTDKSDYCQEENEQSLTSIASYQKATAFKTTCFCTFYSLFFIVYVTFNIVSSYTFNYFKETQEKFNPRINRTSIYREFVYPMWLPFDASISDGYYMVAFWFQPYAFYFLMGGFLTIDCLFLMSLTHLKNQLKVISFALRHVDVDIAKENVSNNERKIEEEMRIVKCVQELQQIYRAAEKLDDLFNVLLLIHNGLIVLVLCCLLYSSTVQGFDSMTTSIVITMILAISLHMFSTCWFCQNFTLECLDVLTVLYELDWLSYPLKLRRTIIFTMARLKKPPYFTLAKWAKIDMIFLTKVTKMAYSFYTLISKNNE